MAQGRPARNDVLLRLQSQKKHQYSNTLQDSMEPWASAAHPRPLTRNGVHDSPKRPRFIRSISAVLWKTRPAEDLPHFLGHEGWTDLCPSKAKTTAPSKRKEHNLKCVSPKNNNGHHPDKPAGCTQFRHRALPASAFRSAARSCA